MKHILIVEDDFSLRQGISFALQTGNEQLVPCATMAEARRELQQNACALVILDLNLPDGNGLELLREIRADGGPPVIVLTANDLESDIVTGLELGADDYITKPFSLMVLRARVNTQLRRQRAPGIRTADGFFLDFARMEFFKGDQRIDLSKTEQKLLRLLVENRGQTLPRELLIARVWSDGAAFVDENALSVTIRRLRGKLEDDPAHPRRIRTVYGIGYTWAVNADG